MSSSLLGLSLLAGQTGTTGGTVFHAVNPATGENLVPDFHEASLAEVNSALNAAAAAFEI
jgi:NADP-dependent aldehyde dehydrogenase